jgi:hypothetical protein
MPVNCVPESHRPCLIPNKPPSSPSCYYDSLSVRPGTYHPNFGVLSSITPLPPALLCALSVSSKSSSATSLSSTVQAAPMQAVNTTREVALKAIPRKKGKGNEESVWSEMQVLQGFDHPNIVRPISPRTIYLPHPDSLFLPL